MNSLFETVQHVWRSVVHSLFICHDGDVYTIQNGTWLGGKQKLLFRQCYVGYIDQIVEANDIKYEMIEGNPGTGCTSIINFILISIARKFVFVGEPVNIYYTAMENGKFTRFLLTEGGEVEMSPTMTKRCQFEISHSVDIHRPEGSVCSVLVTSNNVMKSRFRDRNVIPSIGRNKMKGAYDRLALFTWEELRTVSNLPIELLSFRFAVFGGNAKYVLNELPTVDDSEQWFHTVVAKMQQCFISPEDMQVSNDEWVEVAHFVSHMIEQNREEVFLNFRNHDPSGVFIHYGFTDDNTMLCSKWATPFMKEIGEFMLNITRAEKLKRMNNLHF